MKRMPFVAIVGRPNVGKSSLLNALAGRRISIVQDMPGVTRDRISIPLRLNIGNGAKADDRFVELVDTGGYGFEDPDQLTEHIKRQIEIAMARADLVLFIADAKDGPTPGDETVAALLRRQGIKTVLLANKADSPKDDPGLGDLSRLGLGTPIGVSARTGRNIDRVFEVMTEQMDLTDAPHEVPPPEMMVAIVGKRNAGKSTLVNAIARIYEGDEDRVIVSETPGTTRDSVDVRFEKEGKALTVIDTAGVRKKRHMVTNDIAFYSFHRAERSIRRADVVLMLLDATEPVSEPDKKLAAYISSEFKPVVIVINKWDLARDSLRARRKDGEVVDDATMMEEFGEYLGEVLRHINYAPVAFVTAKDGKNVQAVLDLSQHLFKQATTRISTSKLNGAVEKILTERVPPTASGRRVKVFYATQVDVNPPSIVLVVNNPSYIDESYQRFMINRFRELLPFDEVPIKLLIRPRSQRTSTDADPIKLPAGPAKVGGATAARPVKPRAKPTVRPGKRGGSGKISRGVAARARKGARRKG